jgi:hypothetical protein
MMRPEHALASLHEPHGAAFASAVGSGQLGLRALQQRQQHRCKAQAMLSLPNFRAGAARSNVEIVGHEGDHPEAGGTGTALPPLHSSARDTALFRMRWATSCVCHMQVLPCRSTTF